eukprot:2779968-Rhodomonas_salina.1
MRFLHRLQVALSAADSDSENSKIARARHGIFNTRTCPTGKGSDGTLVPPDVECQYWATSLSTRCASTGYDRAHPETDDGGNVTGPAPRKVKAPIWLHIAASRHAELEPTSPDPKTKKHGSSSSKESQVKSRREKERQIWNARDTAEGRGEGANEGISPGSSTCPCKC